MMNSKIKKILHNLKKKSLSGEDIIKYCDGKVNLLTYPELLDYDTIDEVLGPYKACILLFETRENYGHWCCLFRKSKHTIEFFDSYGLIPDEELAFVPDHFRKINDEEYPYLTYLLYKSKNKIEYNDVQLQEKLDDTRTCGRWVAFRIVCRDIDIDTFNKMMTSTDLKPDDLVTILTANI